jgi:adenylate cyclase
LAADVAGYSLLMSQDEAGTLDALRSHRANLFEPQVASHGGRIVKLMGDGALVEFPSVIDAVECAVAIQENIGQITDPKLTIRIGINLGDVIIEGADIYGDGVNVAARLQALAEPGGIVISSVVYDQIRRKVSAQFSDLGEHQLKNIAEPMRIFAWRAFGVPSAAPAARPALSLPDRPSIAVLPFENMSGDPEQEFFSDGITEDIITELSRYKSLFVVARNSSFVFRGRAVDVREVGTKLGVHYVLEGSMRKVGSRIRVTAQLIKAVSGEHVWAERYDGDLVDVFALQDEISRTIVSTIAGRLEENQAERLSLRPTEDLNAYEEVLQGQKLLHQYSLLDYERARMFFERAVAADPNFARARALLALVEAYCWFWDDNPTRLNRAVSIGETALALDQHESKCHLALGIAHLFRATHDKAGYHFGRGAALNPNDDLIMVEHGRYFMYVDRPKEGSELVRRAMRRNPYHPNWYWNVLGRCHHTAEEFELAIPAFEHIATPQFWTHAYLAACYAAIGESRKAAQHVAETISARPDFTVSGFAGHLPYQSQASLDRFLDTLRQAGLPR